MDKKEALKNRVSAIIPTYNRSRLVVQAVKSALAALDSGDEVIVVDDGSTDKTAEALRLFRDKIKYIYIENSGLNVARDVGIHHSTCPLVAFLDSDDEWLPDKIYLQRKVMEAFPDVLFCYSDLRSHLPDGKIIHNVLDIWRNDQWVGFGETKQSLIEILGQGVPFSSIGVLPKDRREFNIYCGNIYSALMEVYYVWACTLMVRKDAAGKALRFARNRHQICEDWEAFARLAKEGTGAFLDCETAVQNVHTGSRLTDVDNIVQVSERIKLLHRVWGRDQNFLGKNSSQFRKVLTAQHLRRVRYLINQGKKWEAKEDLKKIGGGPWGYRMIANLPQPLIRTLLYVRRRFLRSKQ